MSKTFVMKWINNLEIQNFREKKTFDELYGTECTDKNFKQIWKTLKHSPQAN